MECLFCYKLTFDKDDNVQLTCPDGKTIACSTISKIFQIVNTKFLSTSTTTTSTPICQDCTEKLLHVDRMLVEIKELQLKINRVKDDLFGGLIKCQNLSERDGKSCGNRVKLIEEINANLKNGHGEDNEFPFFNLDFGNYNQLLNQNSAVAADNFYDGSQDQGDDDFFDHQDTGHSTYDDNDDQEDTNLMQHYSSNIIPKNLPVLRIILEPIQVPNYSDNQVSFDINEEPISSFIQRDAKMVKEIQSQRKEIFNQKNYNYKTMRSMEGSKPKPRMKSSLPFEWNCHLCNMNFSTRRSLNRHKQFKHPEFKSKRNRNVGSFECQMCNMKFACSGNLNRHSRNQHPESKTISKVKQSEEPTDKSSFIQSDTKKVTEIQSQSQRLDNFEENVGTDTADISKTISREVSKLKPKSPLSLECHLCNNLKFSRRDCLNRHRRNKHPETRIKKKVDSFECLTCNKKFSDRNSLYRHKKNKHPESLGRDKKYKDGEINETFYYCDQCPRNFTMKSLLRAHINQHHCPPVKCTYENCDKIFKNVKSFQVHMSAVHRSSGEDHPCLECSKTFSKSWLLRYHVKVAHGGETWFCEYCSRALTSKSNLRAHIKGVHMKVKNYKYFCSEPECNGRRFTRPSQFKQHMERIHQKLREVECPSCPPGSKKFYDAYGLKIHTIFAHTEEKPYICQHCSKGCRTLSNLKLHEKIHLRVGNRPS